MSSAKWRPFCLGLNLLRLHHRHFSVSMSKQNGTRFIVSYPHMQFKSQMFLVPLSLFMRKQTAKPESDNESF